MREHALPSNDEPWLELAMAVADGTPVEWSSVASSISRRSSSPAPIPDTSDSIEPIADSDRLLERLACLEQVARAHEAIRVRTAGHGTESAADTLLTEARRNSSLGATEPVRVRWGPLIVLEKLGRGSFGDVYRAWDPRLDRAVALKLIPASGSEDLDSPFIEEGRLLARVRHPNVLTVYGAERIEGRVGIWTEYVKGETLAQEVARRGPLTSAEAARIGVDVCRALAAVHAAGLLHRDVKAPNILRDQTGRIVLGDFGTGIEYDENAAVAAPQIAGTPLYLAPEIFQHQPATVAADLYSVGVLLYFLVTGTYPVRGHTYSEIKRAHATGHRVPLQQVCPDLSGTFIAIVDRLLSEESQRRHGTVAHVQAALEQWLDVPAAPPLPPRVPAWRVSPRAGKAIFAALMLCIAAGAVAGWRGWVPLPIESASAHPSRAVRGVGPSLSLNAGDWIAVARVDNQTGDPLFDVIEAAIKRELEYSEYVRVAQPPRIEDALQALDRPVDSELDVHLAQQVAQRDGQIRALIASSVSKSKSGYLLTLRVVNPANASPVASIVDNAVDVSAILQTIRRQTLQLRKVLGEPAAALERSRQLQLHSILPSLTALRAYTQAFVDTRTAAGVLPERLQATWAEKERLIRSALETDPTFAGALSYLAFVMSSQGRPREDFLPYAERAFKFSENASPQERYLIGALYHHMKGGMPRLPETPDERREVEQAVVAYEALFALQPDSPVLANGLRWAYRALGRDRDLDSMYLRLADARPTNLGLNQTAANQLLRQGNIEGAQRYAARAAAALSVASGAAWADQAAQARLFGAYVAWLQDDAAETARIVAAVEATTAHGGLSKPEQRQLRIRLLSFYASLGRFRDADRVLEALRPAESADVDAVFQADVSRALFFLQKGEIHQLRAFVSTRWRDPARQDVTPWPMSGWINALIEAGLLQEAEERLACFKRRTGLDTSFQAIPLYKPIYMNLQGALELSRGRAGKAVQLLEQSMATMLQLDQNLGTGGLTSEIGHYGAIKLAAAYEATGNLTKAIDLLKVLADNRVGAVLGGPDRWVRDYAGLARLYRKANQESDAYATEARLLKLLTVSDDDNPLLRELRGRMK